MAQTVIGKYAGEFLTLGVGGRALGMGGAYAANANDVTAGYWNPAGLSDIKYPQVALMHAETFASAVEYDYMAVAFPYGENKTIGFSLIRLGVSDIPNTQNAYDYVLDRPKDNAEDYITQFSAADYAMILSYAASTPFGFSYGVNAKLIYENIGSFASAYGVGFDIGGIYAFKNGISLGVNLQDVTTTFVAWTTGRNELISPTAKIGGGYGFNLFSGRFTFGLDTDVRFENRQFASQAHIGPVSFDFHAGGEYRFKNVVAFRAGYDDIGRLTLGAGLKLSKLNIDYSFASFNQVDQLGNSHRISIQLSLEEDRFRRKGYTDPDAVPEPPPSEPAK
jgi:hypothetical protein